jgi:hypothetical protein
MKIPTPPSRGVGFSCQRSADGFATSRLASGERRRIQTAATAVGNAAKAATALTAVGG